MYMDFLTETPADIHIFQFREYAVKLSIQKKYLLRMLVSNILFISFRSQPYLKTSIAFLKTRFN